MRFITELVALAALTKCAVLASTTKDYTQYVDPFIGTEGPTPGSSYQGGNTFPGATLPFGAVKVGIDTTRWNTSFQANAGYTPTGNVTAISMLHVSGTGGAPTYGLIPQMPLTTLEGINVLDNVTYMQPRVGHDEASVGYYKTELASGVVAEMSASMHAGIMRYTFPAAGQQHVLVDLSHYLPTRGKESQWYSNGRIESPGDGWYMGHGTYREGWALGGDYNVYFCGRFDRAPSGVSFFRGEATDPYWPGDIGVVPILGDNATSTSSSSKTHIVGGVDGYQYADRVGAVFHFESDSDGDADTVLTSKVGISWISADKACQFVNDEVPHWDLSTTRAEAVSRWNDEVLSKVDVADGDQNATALQMLYTGLYHAHLMPSDRTGENPHWDSGDEPYYDDYYTLWDTFRCLHALVTLILPSRQTDMVRSMIDIWRHERFMPEGRSHNHNGRVQGGSNSDNVLADAYVKGLGFGASNPINWHDGFAAMRTNAEVVPYNNFDFNDPTCSTKEGRGALLDWKAYGYVTPSYGRAVSRTVEYSLNDYAVSVVADGLGLGDEADQYLERSRGWQRIWHADVARHNFTGFLAPTLANGSIAPGQLDEDDGTFDPLQCGECDWAAISYEGTPWEYSFGAPHDMATLVELSGGPAAFEARLDLSFVPGMGEQDQGNNGIGSMIYNPGNEPSFMTPFLYHYLGGRQWKSVMRGRDVVDDFYHVGAGGIPGNDDAGSMSAWLVWNMLGLYPVVTQPVYLILSPRFSDVTIGLGDGGAMLRMTAEGEGEYVQSLKVNGQQWTQNWVTHSDLYGDDGRGGRLEFVIGTEPVEWDTGDVPPSPGRRA